MNNYDFNTLLVCAFRYALGRKTYITYDIAKIIENSRCELMQGNIELIKREINEALEDDCAGMEVDRQIWRDLLGVLHA